MDARYYNGGPDDEPRFESTGPRREPEPLAYPVGQPCASCGRSIHRVYTLAGVGAFCSPKCRTKAMTAQVWRNAKGKGVA